MSDVENERSRFRDAQDAEVTQYRVVSGLAVTGLILALFTPLACAHPLFWGLPAAAIVVCAAALGRITAAPAAMIGRKAAVAGLLLSVLFGAIACSQWLTFRCLIDWQARQFAERWFLSLRNGEPHKAHQLSEPPESRLPLDEKLWKYYTLGSDSRRTLEGYLRRPEIQSLLALGGEAVVRYYDTERIYRHSGNDAVVLVYAVTCQQQGEKTSYFLRLTVKRHPLPKSGHTYWQVLNFEGAVRPLALGGDEESQES